MRDYNLMIDKRREMRQPQGEVSPWRHLADHRGNVSTTWNRTEYAITRAFCHR